MHACTPAGRISRARLHANLDVNVHGHRRWRCTLALLACSALAAGCADDPLGNGPKREVVQATVTLDLPEVPAFNIPAPHPDGTHSVREMRLKSSKLLKTEVQIKGFVTWIYDCVAELQGPGETVEQVRKKIDADPTQCDKPHFFLGDAPDTSPERSIWVVEVPRKLRADELRLLSRQERANLPKVPDIKVGDEVIVTGGWEKQSPDGFTNSDGLLIYKDLKNLSKDAE